MIYKNAEFHNISVLREETPGSVSWIRVPENVYDNMESDGGKRLATCATGVEIRFVMNSDTVTLRMKTNSGKGIFHVYRGSIQGGWEDHEGEKTISGEVTDFVIKKSENLPILERITNDFNHPFSPEVIRVIFDRGYIEVVDIIGDIRPPREDELPKKTLLAYGSSITHGSNSIDMSHSWVSVTAYNLKMDCINLGMAGSCCMEPEMVDYIAGEGEKGNWHVAVLELGINVLGWEKEKIYERVENVLRQIAGRNGDKKIFVISPFYSYDDYKNEGKSEIWRNCIEEVVKRENYSNVTYINGLDLLGDMSLMSADEVHPNIYGVAGIAEKLTKIVSERL